MVVLHEFMKFIRILITLKVILSFISNVSQQCVSTNGQNKKMERMSIHTSKRAIAGSLGMSKESKCLDEPL